MRANTIASLACASCALLTSCCRAPLGRASGLTASHAEVSASSPRAPAAASGAPLAPDATAIRVPPSLSPDIADSGAPRATVPGPAALPGTPRIQLHAEPKSVAQWTFEVSGFPALAKDGHTVALASVPLGASGPPSLSLSLELRDADRQTVGQTQRFQEPYRAELGGVEQQQLRQRAEAWLARQAARLADGEFRSFPRALENETPTCEPGTLQQLVIAGYEIRLLDTRLRIAIGEGTIVHDHVYSNWRASAGKGSSACDYQPVLAAAALDDSSRLLVIRADHCPASDACDAAIAPAFAVVRLPN